MMRSLRITAVAGVLFSFSTAALADVPPSMDRVPPDAHIITTIRNLQDFQRNIESLAGQIGLPPDALEQMGVARQLLQTPGLNPEGSASVVVLGGGDEREFVAILPVRDYKAFITGLGGAGEGVEEVEIHDQMFFMKNIDGGFAAAGPSRDLVETFAGQPGHAKTHEEFLGPAGRAIADASGVFIVANIPALAPRIREGLQGGFAQAQAMAALMGGDALDMTRAQEVTEAFLRDATAGVMGFRAGEQGAAVEFGAQFREGSELAGYFDAEGDARQLINALPNQPFLLAIGADIRSPNLRRAIQYFLPAADGPEAQKFQGLNPLQALEMTDGFGILWGTTQAIIGGMFMNTVTFSRTEDPEAYVDFMRQGLSAIHGQKIEGITYQTTMQAQEVGDVKAQSWSLRMQIDQRHPGAHQAAQVQTTLFGPGGLRGFIAPAKRGVIMTYSQNSGLLQQAVSAADSPEGLGQEKGISQVSEHLPSGRTFEAYIGVRNILETVLGFAGMFGAGPFNVDLPEDLQPIGLGGTTSGGGVRVAIFMPVDVMATFQQLQAAMEGEDDWEEDEGDTGLPRF